jgi:ABC-type Fe3+-hydroxamate transport system substrate-binding protein
VGAVQRVRERRSAQRRISLAVAGIASLGALLVLTGCGQRSEPTGPSVDIYPVTVEQASGSPVVVDSRPDRVAALTSDAASLVSSVLGRKVAPVQSPAGAGLVVTTQESLQPKPRSAYVAPAASIDDVERALTELGLLLDRPIAARQLVELIETKRKVVHERLRNVKPVSVFVDTGFFSTVSNHSLLGNLIREAGGTNVAGNAPRAGPFDVRRLVQLNPDVYLATSDSGTTLADLRRDPRTRRLKAIRTNHFAILASRVVQPGGEIGTELVAIARYLHPDAFR